MTLLGLLVLIVIVLLALAVIGRRRVLRTPYPRPPDEPPA